jgi:hypothetical protein
MAKSIPKEFKLYWQRKQGMSMTLEECWAKWEPYWHLRQNGPNNLPHGDTYVLGRYGDQGLYTVDNCRVITHRENILERDHKKCVDKLKGKVNNPRGGASVPKHRNGGCRISTPCGEFEHCAAAAKHLGMHRSSIWHRIKSNNWPEWRWIE